MAKKLNYLIIAGLLLLAGCAEFYTFNLFDGMDPVPLPDVPAAGTDLKPTTQLTDLQSSLKSDSFIETLKDEPDQATLTAINSYLEDIFTGGNAGADEIDIQNAAILYADLNLGVTGGDEVINNLLLVIGDIAGGGTTSTMDENAVQTILGSIVPPDIDTPEEFTAMINGMLAASAAYQALSNNINPDQTMNSGEITGGVVMNCVVTGMIDLFVNTILVPEADPGEVLYQIFIGNTASISAQLSGNTISGNPLDSMAYANDIALAAGLDITALFATSN